MKIGTTETFDPSYCIDEWINRINQFDVIYLITKNLTDELIDTILNTELRDKTILHLTCTGLSGTIYEPNSPSIDYTKNQYTKLIEGGFLSNRVILRLDPIIPSVESIKLAIKVLEVFSDSSIERVRVSVLDMYPHVKQRLIDLANKNPEYRSEISNLLYAYSGFHCSEKIIKKLGELFRSNIRYHFEACAEPLLDSVIQLGCVNEYDLYLLGLKPDNTELALQRKNCLCLNKSQLIPGGFSRGRCPNKCLYCYIKDK